VSIEDLEFDISQHFKSSVQLAISLLSGEVENVLPWRWVLIAIHDAIYSALVMKLSRTDMSGVYPDRLEKKFADFYKRGLDSRSDEWAELSREQNQSKMAELSTLVKRAGLASGAEVHKSISSAKCAARSLTLLKKRRDIFVHAGDYTVLATVPELKDICSGSVDVLSEIMELRAQRHRPISDSECQELVNHLRAALRRCD
jgi:hypothetical protein